MKHKIGIACFALCLWFCACKATKKVGYDFPVSMNAVDKAHYTNTCDKGQVLYQISCAECHNVKIKNKSIIPDFTQDQMSRYELKANNMQHDTSEVFTKVTPEELSSIYLFLTYKAKSNVPLQIPVH